MIPLQENISYLSAFLGGIAVSFTPCVYPLIPITLSYIGANSSGSRYRGFILSLVYVTGVALVYAALGMAAGLTGTFFGKVSINPLTKLIVGVAIIIFGLSLWDILPFNVLAFKSGGAVKKRGLSGAFFLGLTSAFIVSPCVSPVLGTILVYVAPSKNIFYGGTLLLTFAYGMGFSLILAGTFGAVLVNLPKAGAWMDKIKKLCGLVLLVIGAYFVFKAIKEIM